MCSSDLFSGASLAIGDMQEIHDAWWQPSTGLLAQATDINDGMVSRMATVEASRRSADSRYDEVNSLLTSAEGRRDAAQQARRDQYKTFEPQRPAAATNP